MNIRKNPDGFDKLVVDAPEFDAAFEVYGQAPVQGFGVVLGRELYFWARHDAWSFDVADEFGNLPSDDSRGKDGFYVEGAYELASYMPKRDAVKIIAQCLGKMTGVVPQLESLTDL